MKSSIRNIALTPARRPLSFSSFELLNKKKVVNDMQSSSNYGHKRKHSSFIQIPIPDPSLVDKSASKSLSSDWEIVTELDDIDEKDRRIHLDFANNYFNR